MADRCTGHCCEDFILPYSPSQLETNTQLMLDHALICRMVLYKGKYRAVNANFPGEPEGHHYTCRYFDKVTRDCTIYEQRPAMCRDHPYNKPCTFKGCELTPELKPDVLLSRLVTDGKLKLGKKVSLSELDESVTRLVGSKEKIDAVSGRAPCTTGQQEVMGADEHEEFQRVRHARPVLHERKPGPRRRRAP